MRLFEEEFLEPFARFLRFKRGFAQIPKRRALIVADLGSGPKKRFLYFAQKNGLKIKKYLPFDPLFNKTPLIKKIPLKDNSVDLVVGFAFLEHIDHPKEILNDSIRILKKGGIAIFTTPTPAAKNVLEFLSFKLGLISQREIKEHQNYFDKNSLQALLAQNKFKIKTEHQYFELGLNNLLVIKKN